MEEITINQTHIRRDDLGRYCLNDLHRAAVLAGANKRTKEPAKFLNSAPIVDLIKEISNSMATGEGPAQNLGSPTAVINDGVNNGTYVVKELVYAYAMWVSPKFHLKVIRAYDALVTAELERLNGLHFRAVRAELEFLEGVQHASQCGLGLRRWRDDKPAMKARLEALRIEMQPALPLFH